MTDVVGLSDEEEYKLVIANIYLHLPVKSYLIMLLYIFLSPSFCSNHHRGGRKRQEEPWWLCRGLGLGSRGFCFPWCFLVWRVGGYWRRQERQNLEIYVLDILDNFKVRICCCASTWTAAYTRRRYAWNNKDFPVKLELEKHFAILNIV